MSSFTLGQLAERLACELVGDPATQITGVSTIEKAGPGEITFLANMKYAPKVASSRASAIIAAEPLKGTPAATLVSSNPYYDFARALALYYEPPKPSSGIHATASIASTAQIGPNPSIGPYVVVGENTTVGAKAVLHAHAVIYEGCRIGDDFTAHSHVSVREFTRIGNRVTLHNGVVVGGDGFGFAKTGDGRQYKIVQTGITVIEDDVEIQTLTSVDRATIGETRVRRGAKIDSLVQIGHACVVGEDNIICGQTGLAGSTILEENVIMAGQTGSAGHLTIHKGAVVWAQSGVGHDVPAGAIVSGSPAFDSREWLRASAAYTRLPELVRTIRALERRVAELEARLPEARHD
ncbi:MAG: UDP-3-O-(3-hydroxymyristoyl)glucosamine N-acyltransferase [Acidobacteriaceae bacterium]|nr:UDP-3-O-(3-hydroxymyristoyl)glucosamine N-acyltransferase [Acidobacteriaceae bacterium]MBV9778460.1 UDP-3-O-(3-hydroxymyristoyl)glucosamine N-acyltransferase [Acidobacteriaceae bacterium]